MKHFFQNLGKNLVTLRKIFKRRKKASDGESGAENTLEIQSAYASSEDKAPQGGSLLDSAKDHSSGAGEFRDSQVEPQDYSTKSKRNLVISLAVILTRIGKLCIMGSARFIVIVVSMAIFALRFLTSLLTGAFYGKNFRQYCLHMGFLSIPLIAFMALFTGMVLALQIYSAFYQFSDQVPHIVVTAFIRQLSPVLCALMMAGYWTSSIAAEIASLKTGDQLDAMVSLSVSPMSYLMIPRVLAGVVALPFLTLISNAIGIFGGYLTGVYTYNVDKVTYIMLTAQSLRGGDFLVCLAKGAIFGFLLTFIGIYEGYHAQQGAQGVGKSATNAVIRACFAVLFVNYLLTAW